MPFNKNLLKVPKNVDVEKFVNLVKLKEPLKSLVYPPQFLKDIPKNEVLKKPKSLKNPDNFIPLS